MGVFLFNTLFADFALAQETNALSYVRSAESAKGLESVELAFLLNTSPAAAPVLPAHTSPAVVADEGKVEIEKRLSDMLEQARELRTQIRDHYPLGIARKQLIEIVDRLFYALEHLRNAAIKRKGEGDLSYRNRVMRAFYDARRKFLSIKPELENLSQDFHPKTIIQKVRTFLSNPPSLLQQTAEFFEEVLNFAESEIVDGFSDEVNSGYIRNNISRLYQEMRALSVTNEYGYTSWLYQTNNINANLKLAHRSGHAPYDTKQFRLHIFPHWASHEYSQLDDIMKHSYQNYPRLEYGSIGSFLISVAYVDGEPAIIIEEIQTTAGFRKLAGLHPGAAKRYELNWILSGMEYMASIAKRLNIPNVYMYTSESFKSRFSYGDDKIKERRRVYRKPAIKLGEPERHLVSFGNAMQEYDMHPYPTERARTLGEFGEHGPHLTGFEFEKIRTDNGKRYIDIMPQFTGAVLQERIRMRFHHGDPDKNVKWHTQDAVWIPEKGVFRAQIPKNLRACTFSVSHDYGFSWGWMNHLGSNMTGEYLRKLPFDGKIEVIFGHTGEYPMPTRTSPAEGKRKKITPRTRFKVGESYVWHVDYGIGRVIKGGDLKGPNAEITVMFSDGERQLTRASVILGKLFLASPNDIKSLRTSGVPKINPRPMPVSTSPAEGGRKKVTKSAKIKPGKSYVWHPDHGTGKVIKGSRLDGADTRIIVEFYDDYDCSYEIELTPASVVLGKLFLATPNDIASLTIGDIPQTDESAEERKVEADEKLAQEARRLIEINEALSLIRRVFIHQDDWLLIKQAAAGRLAEVEGFHKRARDAMELYRIRLHNRSEGQYSLENMTVMERFWLPRIFWPVIKEYSWRIVNIRKNIEKHHARVATILEEKLDHRGMLSDDYIDRIIAKQRTWQRAPFIRKLQNRGLSDEMIEQMLRYAIPVVEIVLKQAINKLREKYPDQPFPEVNPRPIAKCTSPAEGKEEEHLGDFEEIAEVVPRLDHEGKQHHRRNRVCRATIGPAVPCDITKARLLLVYQEPGYLQNEDESKPSLRGVEGECVRSDKEGHHFEVVPPAGIDNYSLAFLDGKGGRHDMERRIHADFPSAVSELRGDAIDVWVPAKSPFAEDASSSEETVPRSYKIEESFLRISPNVAKVVSGRFVMAELSAGQQLVIRDAVGTSSVILRGWKKKRGYVYGLINIFPERSDSFHKQIPAAFIKFAENDLRSVEIYVDSLAQFREQIMPAIRGCLSVFKDKGTEVVTNPAKNIWRVSSNPKLPVELNVTVTPECFISEEIYIPGEEGEFVTRRQKWWDENEKRVRKSGQITWRRKDLQVGKKYAGTDVIIKPFDGVSRDSGIIVCDADGKELLSYNASTGQVIRTSPTDAGLAERPDVEMRTSPMSPDEIKAEHLKKLVEKETSLECKFPNIDIEKSLAYLCEHFYQLYPQETKEALKFVIAQMELAGREDDLHNALMHLNNAGIWLEKAAVSVMPKIKQMRAAQISYTNFLHVQEKIARLLFLEGNEFHSASREREMEVSYPYPRLHKFLLKGLSIVDEKIKILAETDNLCFMSPPMKWTDGNSEMIISSWGDLALAIQSLVDTIHDYPYILGSSDDATLSDDWEAYVDFPIQEMHTLIDRVLKKSFTGDVTRQMHIYCQLDRVLDILDLIGRRMYSVEHVLGIAINQFQKMIIKAPNAKAILEAIGLGYYREEVNSMGRRFPVFIRLVNKLKYEFKRCEEYKAVVTIAAGEIERLENALVQLDSEAMNQYPQDEVSEVRKRTVLILKIFRNVRNSAQQMIDKEVFRDQRLIHAGVKRITDKRCVEIEVQGGYTLRIVDGDRPASVARRINTQLAILGIECKRGKSARNIFYGRITYVILKCGEKEEKLYIEPLTSVEEIANMLDRLLDPRTSPTVEVREVRKGQTRLEAALLGLRDAAADRYDAQLKMLEAETAYKPARPQALIIHAEPFLKSGALVDLEDTIKAVSAENHILHNGKIAIIARIEENGIILRDKIKAVSENIEVDIEVLPGYGIAELETMIGRLRAEGYDMLGIIKGMTYERARLERLRTPVIIMPTQRAIYSFAQAVRAAIDIKTDEGRASWIHTLPPARSLEDIRIQQFQEYLSSLQALVRA